MQHIEDLTNKGRITWVDSVKGIAIYLIVVGHFLNVSSLVPVNKVLYSFHVPLFFVLSGYTYKKPYKNIWDGIIKKIKQLLLPYIIYVILSVIFCRIYGDYELTWNKL